MPNLSEEIRLKCEQVLGRPVEKVKWTDDPHVGLALTGEGSGAWIDLVEWIETKPTTIFHERIMLMPLPTKASKPKSPNRPIRVKKGKKKKDTDIDIDM